MSGWDGLSWAEVLLINAALASILAVLVAGLERWRPKALWLHALWLLVILRFVAPPMVPLEILPSGGLSGEPSSQVGGPGQTEGTRTIEAIEMTPSLAASSTYLGRDTQILPTSSVTSQLSPPSTSPSRLLAGSFAGATDRLWMVFGAAWALVGLVILALTGRQVGRLVALARDGVSPDPHVQQLAQDLADAVGLRRMPRIRVVNHPSLASPMILSTLAGPILLLPQALLDALNDDQLSTVLVHEWAHVRRRDHWVRWPEWLALVVFWWNPAVWWARRALRRSEERCVDAWVLRLLPERRADYARALVETMALSAGSPRHSPVLSSGIETMNSMEGRLTMILQDTSRRRSSEPSPWIRWATWPALVLALTLLPVCGPPLTAGGDEDPKAMSGVQASEEEPNKVLRAEQLAHARERLEEQIQQLETSHGDAKFETQERLEELQARSQELADRQDAAESAREGQMLQEEMQRLEQHWAMQSRSYEMRSAALEAERLHLGAEAAALEGDEEGARTLREEHRRQSEILRQRERHHAEQAMAVRQQHVEKEKQRLQERLEQLQEAGQTRAAEHLERQAKLLQLEGERAAREMALQQEQMALQATQEASEMALQEARRQAEQRIEAMQGAEKAAVQAAMEAERRALEAKTRLIEAEHRQAQAELRAKSLQAELPLRVEELRLAMEEVKDENARQELRAELEKLHRELGEVLAEE